METILSKLVKSIAGQGLMNTRDVEGFRGHWDLAKVKRKWNQKKYRENEEEFERDIRQVCSDAFHHFPQSHYKHDYARCLLSDFQQYWDEYKADHDPVLHLWKRISNLEQALSDAMVELERQEKTNFKVLNTRKVAKLIIKIRRLGSHDFAEVQKLLTAYVRWGRDGSVGFDLGHILVKDYELLKEFLDTHKSSARPTTTKSWFALSHDQLPQSLLEDSSSESQQSSDPEEPIEERQIVSALP